MKRFGASELQVIILTQRFILAGAFGLLAPVMLIPIVGETGHSVVIEELVKCAALFCLLRGVLGRGAHWLLGATLGLAFGLSESFLYLDQIVQTGELQEFWHRLAVTTPMHMTTALVMVTFGFSRIGWAILGIAGAVGLHTVFNLTVLHFV